MAFVSTAPIVRRNSLHRQSAFVSNSASLHRRLFRGAKPCVLRRPIESPAEIRVIPAMQMLDVRKYEVFMPALSSTMSEGRIVQWLKQPGDKIEKGEMIMVVESDKADMEVESFEAGYLATILVDEGNSCDVGNVVGIIVEKEEDIGKVRTSASAAPAPPAPPAPTPPTPVAPVVATQDVSEVPKPKLSEVFMPALSSTMTEGKVVQWLKNEGDAISSGDMVMIVESDKADMEVESFEDGFLAHIAVPEGESCAVLAAVAYLAKSEADIPAVKAWATSQSSAPAPTAPVGATSESAPASAPANTPAPSTTPATIVNEGRVVASPRAKVVAKETGVDLRVVPGSGPGGRVTEADVIKARETGAVSASSTPTTTVVPAGKVIATPDAKKIAKKEKIDLSAVTGTGISGRITAEDVLKAAGKAPASKPAPATKAAPIISTGAVEALAPPPAGAVVMNAMQKAVVQNMNASLTVPVFRITYKIKTAALDELYAEVKPKGVTISALLAKAVGITLAKHPIMNSAYENNAIHYRPWINIAMAVSLKDGGLITPTLKDVNNTDLYSLSRIWQDLVKRALDKKLTPDEYNSGTFFISNLGMFGVEQFDAILPPGAPGILAIGASKPVVGMQKNGLPGVEKEMNVTLTADHRHIYGADGAKFLKDLAELIEGDVIALLK